MPLWLATLTMTATWVDGGYLLGTAEGVYKSSLALGLQGGLSLRHQPDPGRPLLRAGACGRSGSPRWSTRSRRDSGARGRPCSRCPRWRPRSSGAPSCWSPSARRSACSLGIDLTTAILVSAVVVTAYTMIGGMWSVAYTDALQLAMVVVGLAVALPYALGAVGGIDAAWLHYGAARAGPRRPAAAGLGERRLLDPRVDRRLVGRQPDADLRRHPVELLLPARAVVPDARPRPVALHPVGPADDRAHGAAAAASAWRRSPTPWPPDLAAQLQRQPADTLPLLLKHVTPPLVALLGMGAIIGAVTSSFSSSILSAGSMFSWNTCKRLLWPSLSVTAMKRTDPAGHRRRSAARRP